MMATERSTLVLFTSGTCRQHAAHVQLWHVQQDSAKLHNVAMSLVPLSRISWCMPGIC